MELALDNDWAAGRRPFQTGSTPMGEPVLQGNGTVVVNYVPADGFLSCLVAFLLTVARAMHASNSPADRAQHHYCRPVSERNDERNDEPSELANSARVVILVCGSIDVSHEIVG